MQTIWKELDDSVREVRGVPMLQRLCDAMFAGDQPVTAPEASIRPPQQVGASR